jgi:hypothetical protein
MLETMGTFIGYPDKVFLQSEYGGWGGQAPAGHSWNCSPAALSPVAPAAAAEAEADHGYDSIRDFSEGVGRYGVAGSASARAMAAQEAMVGTSAMWQHRRAAPHVQVVPAPPPANRTSSRAGARLQQFQPAFMNDTSTTKTYVDSMGTVPSLFRLGHTGLIYTELMDQECEIQGMFSYDRKVLKMSPDALVAAHMAMHAGVQAAIANITEQHYFV